MEVTIDSVIRVQDVPEKAFKEIKKDLTIKNPAYFKKLAMGLPIWGESQLIKLYSEKDINGSREYILPRGYRWRLLKFCCLKEDINDNRVILDEIEFSNKPSLRDYQIPAIARAKSCEQGVLMMPCGSGKTETAMGIVAELQQPTLWITHTMDLLKQSMDRAVSRLGLTGNQAGIIQGENMRVGSHMTFATVQTLAKRDLSEIKQKFGCVVIDEAHLVFKDAAKARMFESVISQFPAFYRFGLTASEHRSDGLINTMFHVIGPKIYEVDQEELNDAGQVVVPIVKFLETDFCYEAPEGEMLNVQSMLAVMREDRKRNSVLKFVFTGLIKPGNCCLVLGDSLDHLESMQQYVENELCVPAAFVCGTTPKKEREKIMEDMRGGRYQYLFATYQLAKLGLDIPRLDTLILATPKRDKISIQQAVGRIMRNFEGKQKPVVYDIWDSEVKQLRYWARDRVKVYESLGCKVVGGPKFRKRG